MTRIVLSLRAKLIDFISVYGADYLALTKPRLVSMVLLSTAVGFYVGSLNSLNVGCFLMTLLATIFVAAGSMALN